MPTLRLTEQGPQGGHEAISPGRFRVRLITAGQGASGFYTEEALREAADRRVFAAGTHLYVDHPGDNEQADRQRVGRRVRDLAGTLVTDGVFRDGAIIAEAQVFSHWRPLVEEVADVIGMSIRGFGQADADGVVQRIDTIESVDFVTRAGAGGRVLELIEAARAADPATTQVVSTELSEAVTQLQEARNLGAWLESRIHLSFTERADDMFGEGRLTREERIALSSAIGDALDAFRASIEAGAPQLYERDLFDDPPEPTPVPITATESKEPIVATNPDNDARITALEESIQTLTTERDEAVQRAETAETEASDLREARERDERQAEDTRLITEALAAVDIPEGVAHLSESIRSRAARDVTVDRDSDGNVRSDVLNEAATAAVTSQVEFLTEAVGERIVGLGEGAQNAGSAPKGDGHGSELTEAQRTNERIRSAFAISSTN